MAVGYNELIESIQPQEDHWSVFIPENWMQGRTTYGGLSAALCLQGALRDHPTLPPLRSAQINFIGPAGGAVTIHSRALRQGKSVTFVEATIVGEKGLATHAVFCFGATRDSRLGHDFKSPPQCRDVKESKDFFEQGPGPVFTANFDCLLAQGSFPFSGSDECDHYLWIRFKEQVEANTTALLALGDMPPPAVLPMFKEFAPISSMNWSVNFLQTEFSTKDGWWLMRTCGEDAKQGYSSQDMQVWNSDKQLVMTGRQSVAVFY